MRAGWLFPAALLALAHLVAMPALALAPIGPPRALLEQGRWAVDTEYSYGQMDLASLGAYTLAFSYDISPTPSYSYDYSEQGYSHLAINDLRSHIILASIGYGLSDNWDIYVRCGIADAKASVNSFSYGGGFGIAYGLGTRATIHENGSLAWGAAIQVTWANPGSDTITSVETFYPEPEGSPEAVDVPLSGPMEMNWRETQILIGPTWSQGNMQAYGGLVLHFVNGDLTWTGTYSYEGTVEGSTETVTASGTINHQVREESDVGGCLGILWQAMDRASIYVEGQFTGTDWCIGAGAHWATP